MAKVVVLGGGIAGLSAAHELAERGFEVVIAEKTGVPGGKARSSPVRPIGPSPWGAEPRYEPRFSAEPVSWVPGEHGFRFFPGFYRHVVDTMERIPSTEGVTAAGHLVPTARCALSQYDRPTFSVPVRFLRSPGDVGAILGAIVAGFGPVADLTAGDLAHFGARIWQILTSCQERRLAEYERVPWWTFIGAASRSVAYQKFLAAGITRSLVAAHAETANTRTIGDIFIQLLLDIIDPSMPTSDRVLDGPTNEVWLYPWLQHLRTLGVTYLPETAVTAIRYSDGRVHGVTVTSGRGTETLVGDYYVCALPAERAAPVFSSALIAAEPRLACVRQLADTCMEWMNGVQFYLRRPVRMARGHTIHIDTEWALTSISQIDVWRPGTMDRYGPQTIQSIVSVDVSDWDAPAPNGRTATEHSREEIGPEVWRQLKRSMNVVGEEEVLRDDDLIGWFLDSDIDRDPSHPGRLMNTEPLLVNLVDSWRLRPDAATAVPNLFLASDYVRTNTDLATMEGA
ncbi:MAG: FAD-dependent oxidoreductase, partial [Pseudonocardia sp.]|nr:FAD-dependent oxidoreductase [Pseudonocardia sp.]